MPYKDKEQQREHNKLYQRKYYEGKKGYYKKKAVVRKNKLKLVFNAIKALLKCNKCGENRIATLDFHHKDATLKDFSIGEAIHNGYSIERIKIEIDKCEVLCSNCHRIHHFEEKFAEMVNLGSIPGRATE